MIYKAVINSLIVVKEIGVMQEEELKVQLVGQD